MPTRSRRSSPVAGALAAVALAGLGIQPVAAQNAAAVVASARQAVQVRPTAATSARRDVAGARAALDAEPEREPTAARGGRERAAPWHILADQRAIWTSPFRLRKDDLPWVAASVVATAALVAGDKETYEHVSRSPGSVRTSKRVSALGAPSTLYGAAGAMYLIGRLTRDDRARETGLLAAEALVSQSIVVGVLKAATNRERPDKADGQQDFFDGGRAFPSGHAAASWAFAAVVAEQYRDRPVVRWGAFGVATAVSVSRVTALKHSPSDVFVGGLIGYLIGRRVAARGMGARGGRTLTLAPVVSAPTRTVGVAGSIRF